MSTYDDQQDDMSLLANTLSQTIKSQKAARSRQPTQLRHIHTQVHASRIPMKKKVIKRKMSFNSNINHFTINRKKNNFENFIKNKMGLNAGKVTLESQRPGFALIG